MRYSSTCLQKISANNEFRAGIRAALNNPSPSTLLATETIEAQFQRCQGKTPTIGWGNLNISKKSRPSASGTNQ
jgi:hypothetical protein